MTKKAAPSPELMAIRDVSQRLAAANRELTARAEAQKREIAEVVLPITERHRAGIDLAAAERAELETELLALVQAAPSLFVKPRSISVDGVKCGYRKEEDGMDWDDEQAVIARIDDLHPELYHLLVRETKSIVVDALSQLEARQLRQVGVRLVSGADRAFVSIGESEVDKLVKAIVSDAHRRIADDDGPKPKKVKAKASPRVREPA